MKWVLWAWAIKFFRYELAQDRNVFFTTGYNLGVKTTQEVVASELKAKMGIDVSFVGSLDDQLTPPQGTVYH